MARSDHVNTKALYAVAGAVSATVPSFTPQANSIVIVVVHPMIVGNGVSDVIATANSSLTGGLTWTKIIGVDSGAMGFSYSMCLEVWRAEVGGSPSAIAPVWSNSVNSASNLDNARVALQVFSQTGYDTGSPVGATASSATLGTSGTGAMTLSGAPASGSYVYAARGIAQDGTTDITATPGSGWTEVYDVAAVSGSEGYACLQTQERTGSTSTSVAWTEINANSQAVFGQALGVAVEIKMAGGGGGGGGAYYVNILMREAIERAKRAARCGGKWVRSRGGVLVPA